MILGTYASNSADRAKAQSETAARLATKRAQLVAHLEALKGAQR